MSPIVYVCTKIQCPDRDIELLHLEKLCCSEWFIEYSCLNMMNTTIDPVILASCMYITYTCSPDDTKNNTFVLIRFMFVNR